MAGNPAWLSRQFQGQFPGMESEPRPRMTRQVQNVYSPEHNALESETVRRVTALHHSRPGDTIRPAGMRGSIPERVALSHRLDKQRQGRERWDSFRARLQDEDIGGDYDMMDEPPEPHPATGLPSYGSARTYPDRSSRAFGLPDEQPVVGFHEGQVPHPLSFHGSSASARKQWGSREWIPVAGLRTVQPTVSLNRVHQIIEDPKTGVSPRIPMQGYSELPDVFEQQTGLKSGERVYTGIDGNHRLSGEILQNRMFTEANVVREENIPDIGRTTTKISRAKTRASSKVNADFVEHRVNRLVYGDDDYGSDDTPTMADIIKGKQEERTQRRLEAKRSKGL